MKMLEQQITSSDMKVNRIRQGLARAGIRNEDLRIHSNMLPIVTVMNLTFLTFLDHLLVQGRPVLVLSSIFDIVPCLQSVGISSCLPVCCSSISFSVGLCSSSQKPLVLAMLHRCDCVLASSSSQITSVFCFLGTLQQV